MVELLGFSIERSNKKRGGKNDIEPFAQSFSPPINDDGASIVVAGGTQAYGIDVDHAVRSEAELVARYRDVAGHPEVESAIDDIVNEALITDNPDQPPISIDLTSMDLPPNLVKEIEASFHRVYRLLQFDRKGYETFVRWYIDGRMYFHIIIDPEDPTSGITELRAIDSIKLRKVREVTKGRDPRGMLVQDVVNEYYVYSETAFKSGGQTAPLYYNQTSGSDVAHIAKDAIIHVVSGLQDSKTSMVVSHLHGAIKPLNQVRMMEDASVIYRLVRAPARKVFYLGVGGLPRSKAEQYVNDMMTRHKNRVVYDQVTGEVRDDRKFMTMVEDYWIPRRDANDTQIETLPEGQNLGQMEDVNYFLNKLYEALKVPTARLQPNDPFNGGRPAAITNDELKFSKFVARLRAQFVQLFSKAMEKDLLLRQVISPGDWEHVEQDVKFVFAEDNYFEELKQAELLRDRAATMAQMAPYVGQYVSRQWVWQHIWRFNEDQVEEMMQEIMNDPMADFLMQQELQQQQMEMQGQPNQEG